MKAGIDLGPARVFWWEDAWEPPFNKFFPGLAMARSFGDQVRGTLSLFVEQWQAETQHCFWSIFHLSSAAGLRICLP